jgi:hypothetical protein
MASRSLCFMLLLLVASASHGYGMESNREMSRRAALASNLSSRLPALGLVDLNSNLPSNTIVSPVYCLNGFGSDQRSVLELIALGAYCEDVTPGTEQLFRYSNHFYDPAHGGAGYFTFPSSLARGLETTEIATQDYS